MEVRLQTKEEMGSLMLVLYNTMSRKKEVFKPLDDKKVKMFTCGPSIYRRPHVGNYRSFLWEDVLQRYLEYLGYAVERVINFTDVEDKAIAEAEKEGTDVNELTRRVADRFFQETELLRIKLPDYIPRSSTSVDSAAEIIRILLEKGYAYWDKGDVFFDPLEFKGFGRLYGLDMSRWPKRKKRFRRDTYPGTRWNLGDFILWHGSEEGDKVFWETEIGRGRPSWNIQDPAMISKHLGPRVDICCGGIDNLFRHHDYNIAVMEAVSGEEFAHYWVHGEHLLADGKKMSKSRGNIVYPEDLTEQSFSARQIRFYLLYGHHRKRMNLTTKAIGEASGKLEAFRKMVEQVLKADDSPTENSESDQTAAPLIERLTRDFEEHMSDDLDIKGAFDTMFEDLSKLSELKKAGQISRDESRRIERDLRGTDEVLQVIFP
jgi:cysteinyl-tRNA synthetase